MSWNYRVVAVKDKNGNYFYSIRDVYYDKNDKPTSWGTDPQYPAGQTVDDVYNDINLMQGAFVQPVLIVNDDGKTLRKGKARVAMNEPKLK